MTTYTIECGGFTGSQLPSVAAVQEWLDQKKDNGLFSLKGEQVRIYRFIDGRHVGGPDFVGVAS